MTLEACTPYRGFNYMCLFACSTVLLGLTAYRIHYTKDLRNGDVLTNKSRFYDPIIVELLVTSILAMLFSLGLMIAVLTRRRGKGHLIGEHVMMGIVWIMFLVGAAITTHKWLHLKWCRGSYRYCRILETIKAFSWICWILTTFAIIASLIHLATRKDDDIGGTAYPSTATSDIRHTRATAPAATTYVAHNNRTTETTETVPITTTA